MTTGDPRLDAEAVGVAMMVAGGVGMLVVLAVLEAAIWLSRRRS